MNLSIITVDRRKMFMQFSEDFYDLHIHDRRAFGCNYAEMFATEAGIKQLFKDVYAGSLLSTKQIAQVERMRKNDQPFLIVVVENDDVIATVLHHDVEY
jgi:hypothetical protein